MVWTGKEKSRPAVAKRDFFWDGMVEIYRKVETIGGLNA